MTRRGRKRLALVLAGLMAASVAIEESMAQSPRDSFATQLAKSATRKLYTAAGKEEAVVAFTMLEMLIEAGGQAGERIEVGLEEADVGSALERFEGQIGDRRLQQRACMLRNALAESLGFCRGGGVPQVVKEEALTVTVARNTWFLVDMGPDSVLEVRLRGEEQSRDETLSLEEDLLPEWGEPQYSVFVQDSEGRAAGSRTFSASKPALIVGREGGTRVRIAPPREEEQPALDLEKFSTACLAPGVASATCGVAMPQDGPKVIFRRFPRMATAPDRAKLTEDGARILAAGSWRLDLPKGSGGWFRGRSSEAAMRVAIEARGMSCDTQLELYRNLDHESPWLSDDDSGSVSLAARLEWLALPDKTFDLKVSELGEEECPVELVVTTTQVEGRIVEVAEAEPASLPLDETLQRFVLVPTGSLAVLEIALPKRRIVRLAAEPELRPEPGQALPLPAAQDGASRFASLTDEPLRISLLEPVVVTASLEAEPLDFLASPRWPAAPHSRRKPQVVQLRPGRSTESIDSTELIGRIDLGANQSVEVYVYGLPPEHFVSANLFHGSSADDLEIDYTAGLLPARYRAERDERLELRIRQEFGEGPVPFVLDVRIEETHNGFEVGDSVILRRHEVVDGTDNWAPDMDEFVGCRASINLLEGQEANGLWLVRVDIDGGKYVWRTQGLVRSSAENPGREDCVPAKSAAGE